MKRHAQMHAKVPTARTVAKGGEKTHVHNTSKTLGKIVHQGKGIIRLATAVFFQHGGRAALDFLGPQKGLMPRVFARAKYVERSAKRQGLINRNDVTQPERPELPISP